MCTVRKRVCQTLSPEPHKELMARSKKEKLELWYKTGVSKDVKGQKKLPERCYRHIN